jgi:hypothetical protein
MVLAVFWAACGDASAILPELTIEPLTPTATPQPAASIDPAAPAPTATPEPLAAPSVNDAPLDGGAEPPPPPPPATFTQSPPTATPEPAATPAPPNAGRWIAVDVTNFAVRLMDGTAVVREIAPVGVGAQIDTGAYLSTQTGLFYVHTMTEALSYDAPFDTYISHWIGFDAARDNGFHSFLKDKDGAVVDPSTGRVSNGCIRVGGIEAVFAFATIGMPVYVHH